MTENELLKCEREMEEVLAKAAVRWKVEVEPRTPLDYAILKEEAEVFEAMAAKDEDRLKFMQAVFDRIFEFLYEDGPHPGWVLRRVYLLARRYCPERMLNMNGTDLGNLFGESRAAQSWRMQKIFDRLKASGVRGFRGGGCKTEGSRAAYAEAAGGNHNRRGKTKKGKKS